MFVFGTLYASQKKDPSSSAINLHRPLVEPPRVGPPLRRRRLPGARVLVFGAEVALVRAVRVLARGEQRRDALRIRERVGGFPERVGLVLKYVRQWRERGM